MPRRVEFETPYPLRIPRVLDVNNVVAPTGAQSKNVVFGNKDVVNATG